MTTQSCDASGAATVAAGLVADLALTPGMPADSMIRTGEHTLVAYLARPLTDAFSRSFVED